MDKYVHILKRLEQTLDETFPAGSAPSLEQITQLRARISRLRESIEPTPAGVACVSPLGSTIMYRRLHELLSLYKEIAIPILVAQEKRKLATILNMASTANIHFG